MTISGKIAFLDLVSVHEELEKELVPVFQKALRTAGFIGGPMVEEFERSFAAFCETGFAIGVNSGTDALRFALMAAGVRQGESVVTVPNTFIATTEAISQAGARPEFVDIEARTYNMDPEKLRNFLEHQCSRDHAGKMVSRRTGRPVKAVVPVHLYGQSADMDSIQELADRYNLIVIEDACQAHGARYRGRRVGSLSSAAAFSFYPTKNLGAYGEGGALVTGDDRIAQFARAARHHGQVARYVHEFVGYNYRMDGFQGAVLRVKLKHLDEWMARRHEIAREYRRLLAGAHLQMPQDDPRDECAYHLFVVYVDHRDAVRTQLEALGVETAVHYPRPVHLQKAYAALGYPRGTFPHAERACERVLSLPFSPSLTAEQIRHVATLLTAIVGAK